MWGTNGYKYCGESNTGCTHLQAQINSTSPHHPSPRCPRWSPGMLGRPRPRQVGIDGFTNFIHTILTKVVPDNLKACPKLVWCSNNQCMQSGFQVVKYHCLVQVNEMTRYQVPGEETSIVNGVYIFCQVSPLLPLPAARVGQNRPPPEAVAVQ